MKCQWQALICRKSLLSFLNINGIIKLSHLKKFLGFCNIPLGMVRKLNVLILSKKKKKNTEALVVTRKEIGLEVYAEKTKYMVMS